MQLVTTNKPTSNFIHTFFIMPEGSTKIDVYILYIIQESMNIHDT